MKDTTNRQKRIVQEQKNIEAIDTFSEEKHFIPNVPVNRGSPWTSWEREYVKKSYRRLSVEKIAGKLGRSPQSIYHQAWKLGLKIRPYYAWTRRDLEFLRKNYLKMSSMEIARHLDRTYAAVTRKAHILGIVKKPMHWWTEADVRTLVRWFRKIPLEDLAKRIGATPRAVYTRACVQGLTKRPNRTIKKQI